MRSAQKTLFIHRRVSPETSYRLHLTFAREGLAHIASLLSMWLGQLSEALAPEIFSFLSEGLKAIYDLDKSA
jgi:hypothetical protein